MSRRFYGSLNNRFDEGKNYTGRELKVGDDITMYFWSDRHCYYITDVISQKEIKVKPYYVCADQDKPKGMGHQDWMYFKTLKEHNVYLNKYYSDKYNENPEEPSEETWTFRYNKWMKKVVYTKEKLNQIKESLKSDLKNPTDESLNNYSRVYTHLTEKQTKDVLNGKSITKYFDLSGKISFGVKDYYYDWEF